MLKQRVITGVVLLLGTGFWLFGTKSFYFDIITLGLTLAGFYELLCMYKFKIWQIIGAIILIVGIDYALYVNSEIISSTLRWLIVAFWCFVVPFILAVKPKQFNKITILLIGLLIFILAFYAIIILKTMLGALGLLSIMAIAWIADTGAYFVGRSIGHFKLAPSISPGKSIEGACGGIILVIVYLIILKEFFHVAFLYSYVATLKFGVIITIISIMGDLFESWLKRVAQVKDSGNILPGHGGIFDRVDALVAVLAIAYAMLYNLL